MVTTRSKASGGSSSPPVRIGVAVVGFSGGGAATLGHTDPVRLLQQIQLELGRCHASAAPGTTAENKREVGEAFPPIPYIRHALYVSLHSGKGLDHATKTDLARWDAAKRKRRIPAQAAAVTTAHAQAAAISESDRL